MNTNKLPKVAVLLAAYNGTQWIEEQIESILNQIKVAVTIFISIDTSTDGTREFLEARYLDNNKIIILDDIEKLGGAAKNFYRLIRDVAFNEFDYISLSDQDDIWNNDKLFNACKILSENNFKAYSSNVTAFWEDGKILLIDKAQNQTAYDHLFEAAGPGCTYILTVKLALEVKSFIINKWSYVNKIELHDWLIYAYARENNYKWYIDKKPSMMYRQHTINVVGANTGINAKIKRLKMILSSWYRNETIKIINILGLENKFSLLIQNKTYLNNILLLRFVFNFRRRFKEKIFLSLLLLTGIY
ncbi:glycosyltransferase [bacterium]|jgi:rhamnosyltransferase|nr:glycosyltransferase [bacterium]